MAGALFQARPRARDAGAGRARRRRRRRPGVDDDGALVVVFHADLCAAVAVEGRRHEVPGVGDLGPEAMPQDAGAAWQAVLPVLPNPWLQVGGLHGHLLATTAAGGAATAATVAARPFLRAPCIEQLARPAPRVIHESQKRHDAAVEVCNEIAIRMQRECSSIQ